MVCPSCGTELPDDAKRCTSCGQRMGGGASTAIAHILRIAAVACAAAGIAGFFLPAVSYGVSSLDFSLSVLDMVTGTSIAGIPVDGQTENLIYIIPPAMALIAALLAESQSRTSALATLAMGALMAIAAFGLSSYWANNLGMAHELDTGFWLYTASGAGLIATAAGRLLVARR